jgi:hypothetical protein
MGARARSRAGAGEHTCRTPDCTDLVPVLRSMLIIMTLHSSLYNRHPLHTMATYKYLLLWEGWASLR